MGRVLQDTSSRGPFLVELRCELEFTGPLHVGSGQALSLATDAPVLRDADGKVWLPASSVRGVLADWCQREAPLLGVDRDHVRRLLGDTPDRGARNDDRQGRLTVLDVVLKSAVSSRIRDHVGIDREWGAAAKGAKFDQEVAHPAAGTLRLIYEGDGPADPELVLLRSVADAMRRRLLAFGGKTGWGLGAARLATLSDGTANICWSCIDRSTPDDLSTYLKSRLASHTGTVAPMALDEELPASPRPREEGEPVAWSWLRLDLCIDFDGPMIVAALDMTDPSDMSETAKMRREADAAWHVGPDGKAVLAGSALRGVLRTDAERIVKTLGLGDLADALFGTEKHRGLVQVHEGRITGDEKSVLLNHVSIDRVTGFAADGRLFNVAALASPSFRSMLHLRWNHEDPRHQAAVALLLFVLRDGEQRGMWIGSRTTRGYGYAKTVRIEAAEWSLVVACSSGSDEVTPDCGEERDISPSACHRRGGECDKTSAPSLGRHLGFVEKAWTSLMESCEQAQRTA